MLELMFTLKLMVSRNIRMNTPYTLNKVNDGSMLHICLYIDDLIFTKNNPHIF